MIKENNTKNSLEELLRIVVIEPTTETKERNKNAEDKLIRGFNLWIDSIPRKEERPSELLFLWITALQKELTWAIISTLSCSYVSALIITRSIFEMLIKGTTYKKGEMKEMLGSIEFLTNEERDEFYKLWRGLSGWSHPYKRWIDRIDLETLMSFRYDQQMCEECVNYLLKVCDLMMVVALEKGFCKSEKVSRNIEILGLEFSMKRLNEKRM